jgi:toxin FitB
MVLADTNVVSELMRRHPDPRVVAWSELQPELALSVITLEELRFGIARTGNAVLEHAYDQLIARCTIYGVDEPIARRAGDLRARLSKRGLVRHQADMLIAATAHERGCVLATRNVRDFAGCAIRLVNPFAR